MLFGHPPERGALQLMVQAGSERPEPAESFAGLESLWQLGPGQTAVGLWLAWSTGTRGQDQPSVTQEHSESDRGPANV